MSHEEVMNVDSVTTVEEDKHSAAARSINKIWEYTQAFIASTVITANIVAPFMHVENEFLRMLGAIIVGFYFGRTNHQRFGGAKI